MATMPLRRPATEGKGHFKVLQSRRFDVIPMWVADMNLSACLTSSENSERVDHPTFGYFNNVRKYYDSSSVGEEQTWCYRS